MYGVYRINNLRVMIVLLFASTPQMGFTVVSWDLFVFERTI